ncbi:GNAT family N-acetyltransferase [Mesorhizobium sp. LHD-90]|uniref:GNAT family N-acetyltransferase n=1 Tax=Mesorhizobium sp. LHD-90 TaxID=3071414 RepID=UPI0027E04F57|nr:GNAT family N-acetyltransferase [Mesorhizobium sp. LHD-90]MDQ6433531.1 GNAT family N-acetyltransferase [Mesorhizobium sp. LHD-90]
MSLFATERLILRNWRESDRDLFHRINSDDTVMEFFPFRRDRAESDAMMDRMRAEIDRDGFGWTAAEIATTGECIGFVGLHAAEIEPVVPPGSFEIGWRLAPEYWGKGYVTEAAARLIDHGFDELGLAEIVSFAVWDNERSISVMRRLGMTKTGEFDHPRVPDTHPNLKRHRLYRISQEERRQPPVLS